MMPSERLIVAVDMTDGETALTVAKKLQGVPWAFKINYPLVLGAGPRIITEMSGLGRVICDFKVADIPFTNGLIAGEAFRRGASGLIVHGFTGADSVSECVKVAGEFGDDRAVYVVTEMSHPGGTTFTQPNADALCAMAVEAGASGVIAPATRPDRLRYIRERVGSLEILSPGVGAQGGSAAEAVRAGADRIIVGRSITGAGDPKGAARSIIEELETV
jgi:orotidine-5'-phosphate decarboxylase